jgi:hypothetical protein
MKKVFYVLLSSIVLISLVSCAKKVQIYDAETKEVTEVDAKAYYYMQQAKAYDAYIDALKNPADIATVTDPKTGSVISIKNQVPPPMPSIKQHENQWIRPVMGFFDNLAKYGFYGFGLKTVADAFKDSNGTEVVNSGAGSVTVTSSEGQLNQSSGWVDDNSDSSDNRADYNNDSSQTTSTEEANTTTTTTTDTVTTTTTDTIP